MRLNIKTNFKEPERSRIFEKYLESAFTFSKKQNADQYEYSIQIKDASAAFFIGFKLSEIQRSRKNLIINNQ